MICPNIYPWQLKVHGGYVVVYKNNKIFQYSGQSLIAMEKTRCRLRYGTLAQHYHGFVKFT